MKPWLLNILACPIDKHHPLEAHFFRWKTAVDEMKNLVSAEKSSPQSKKNYRYLAKQLLNGTISPNSLRAIKDLTGSKNSKILLESAVEVLDNLKGTMDRSEDELLQGFSDDLDVLYRFLNLVEVDSGLLVCPKCNRWYPIGSAVETIPELLPDDLREKSRDKAWLERWQDLVPKSILKNGKPFNLNTHPNQIKNANA